MSESVVIDFSGKTYQVIDSRGNIRTATGVFQLNGDWAIIGPSVFYRPTSVTPKV